MSPGDPISRFARFMPGLVGLAHYDPRWLPRDLTAGLSVAAIALPVGIAYADLAGVPAATGIYAAIFPLFAHALFGSSRQLIVGPDAATCLMIAASVAPLAQGDPQRYLALVTALTVITALLYLVAGLLRLGFFASFLSQPILTGYLNGVAIVIIVGQLPKLLGFATDAHEALPAIAELIRRLGDVHFPTAALSVTLLVLLLAIQRLGPGLPAPVIVVCGIGAAAVRRPARGSGV